MSRRRAAADDTLRIRDWDAAEAGLNVDDKDDHRQRDHAEREHAEIADRPCLDIGEDCADVLRQSCDDTGEDDERDAVADTVRCDLFSEPHEEHRPRRQCDGDDEDVHGVRVENRGLEADRHADRLEEREHHRQVARDLRRFLMPLRAFLRPLLERRYNDVEQLDDDGCVDVGRNAHCKDGKFAERTARKEIEEAEQRSLREELLNRRGVNARHGDVRPHAEHGKHDEREDDLLPQLGNLKDVAKGTEHLRPPLLCRLLLRFSPRHSG